MKKSFIVIVLLVVFCLANPTKIDASEGLVELRSQNNQEYKCFASSVLMQDLYFTMAVTCRDLLYPADNSVSKYVLWAVPAAGGAPLRLAELGLGRLEVRTNIPFSELYVVFEQQRPSQIKADEEIVMRGTVQPLRFLDRPGTPTPLPEGTIIDPVITTDSLSFGEKISASLRQAGLVLFLLIVSVVGLVFVITKAKG
jgi:hypothetical protein